MKKETEIEKNAQRSGSEKQINLGGEFKKTPRYRVRKGFGKKRNTKRERGIYFFAW